MSIRRKLIKHNVSSDNIPSSSATHNVGFVPNTLQLGNQSAKRMVYPAQINSFPVTQSVISLHTPLPTQAATRNVSRIPNTLQFTPQYLKTAVQGKALSSRRNAILKSKLDMELQNSVRRNVSNNLPTSTQLEAGVMRIENSLESAEESLKKLNFDIANGDSEPKKDTAYPKRVVKKFLPNSKKIRTALADSEKKLVHGRGVKKVGRPKVEVVDFGTKRICPDLLADTIPILYLRYSGKKTHNIYLKEEITRELADCFLWYLKYHKIPTEVEHLSSSEYQLFHETMDNCKLMSPKEKKTSMIRLIDIISGEIDAGDDNVELPKELWGVVQDSLDEDYLTPLEANQYVKKYKLTPVSV